MAEDELLPLRSVRYGPPKVSLKNANIESGLRNTLVPAILKCCSVVAVRSIFDFSTHAEAVKQLAARRKQIEDALLKLESVGLPILLVLCLVFSRSPPDGWEPSFSLNHF